MKITRATFKSFIKKNDGKLFVKVNSNFDGMVDCVMPVEDQFSIAKADGRDFANENTLGISGVWLVGGRDYFNSYEKDGFSGIEVSNCCGSFIVTTKN